MALSISIQRTVKHKLQVLRGRGTEKGHHIVPLCIKRQHLMFTVRLGHALSTCIAVLHYIHFSYEIQIEIYQSCQWHSWLLLKQKLGRPLPLSFAILFQIIIIYLSVLRNFVDVLHNAQDVLHNVQGALHNALGVLRNVLVCCVMFQMCCSMS